MHENAGNARTYRNIHQRGTMFEHVFPILAFPIIGNGHGHGNGLFPTALVLETAFPIWVFPIIGNGNSLFPTIFVLETPFPIWVFPIIGNGNGLFPIIFVLETVLGPCWAILEMAELEHPHLHVLLLLPTSWGNFVRVLDSFW